MHTVGLPFWFLVLSLFLPRISLLVMYLQDHPGGAFVINLVPLLIAVLVPRLLILFLIYTAQGFSVWFLIHAVGLLMAWGGIGGGTYRRRYRSDI
ncbi:MAG: hypothetical protein ACRYGF_03265 [Janthinobacterium lividum]